MPRSPDEILAHARTTLDQHVVISPEEAQAMVDAHIERRRQTSGKVPSASIVLGKLLSGQAHVLGKRIKVE